VAAAGGADFLMGMTRGPRGRARPLCATGGRRLSLCAGGGRRRRRYSVPPRQRPVLRGLGRGLLRECIWRHAEDFAQRQHGRPAGRHAPRLQEEHRLPGDADHSCELALRPSAVEAQIAEAARKRRRLLAAAPAQVKGVGHGYLLMRRPFAPRRPAAYACRGGGAKGRRRSAHELCPASPPPFHRPGRLLSAHRGLRL
jgi:hypothetical protein